MHIIHETYIEGRAVTQRDLGYRSIQRTGRGSYIISLPKHWVQHMRLDRGSQLAFQIQSDSSLTLTPRQVLEGQQRSDAEHRTYHIPIAHNADPLSLRRKLISLYVTGADLIHLQFESRTIPQAIKSDIRDLIRNTLLGSEILEETPTTIAIQILVNYLEFPLQKAIRRMAILALSAHEEVIQTLKDINRQTLQNVFNLHDDVNRLGLYVIRQLKFGLERDLYKELDFQTPKEFLGYRIVVNDIKNISTNARNIGRNILAVHQLIKDEVLFIKGPVDEDIYTQLRDFNSSCQAFFDESIKALFKRDYEHADTILSQLESHVQVETDILLMISNTKLDPNLSALFRIILDSSQRILEYSRNIAEVTLNRTVETHFQDTF